MRDLFFQQQCPVCGRPMRVRIEFRGERIRCGHCNAVCDAHESLAGTPSRFQLVGSGLEGLRATSGQETRFASWPRQPLTAQSTPSEGQLVPQIRPRSWCLPIYPAT